MRSAARSTPRPPRPASCRSSRWQAALEVPVEIEFWPRHLIEDRAESIDEAASHGTLEWPEPIVDGKIDLGPVIYETFATGLDPYPKREGVSFEWSEPGAESAPKRSRKARLPPSSS